MEQSPNSSIYPVIALSFALLFLLPIPAEARVSALSSDDFNSFNLDTVLWTFVDPVGDATLTMTGTNTQDAWVTISVPAGTSHDVWTAGNQAPRIMQPAADTDFEIEVKFESELDQRFQLQGVVVEEDSDDFLRFDFHGDNPYTRLFAASFDDGVPLQRANSAITNTSVAPLYMRVRRDGDGWMQSYSYDGVSWTLGVSFTHALSVTSMGAFVGNAGTGPPAHTGAIDYFFTTASPIDPEDGDSVVDSAPPLIYNVQDAVVSTQFRVDWSTDEPVTGTVRYGETTAYELGSVSHDDFSVHHSVLVTGLQPNTTYSYQVVSRDSSGNAAFSENFVLTTDPPTASEDPVIDVWYGHTQQFGHIGNPQTYVNILGNVSDPDGVDSLVYSLNGGPELPLSIGPDTRRLASDGDFNIDLLYTDLVSGANQVVMTATDSFNYQAVDTVTLEYIGGNVWPQPYTIEWGSTAAIQDVAQVVDGLWALEPGGVRPIIIGYDRLLAIGDMSWDDYEVTVPIIIHEVDMSTGPVSGDPGLGILMRWTGHTDSPVYGWQPKVGWEPNGAIGWWRWASSSSATLQFHQTGVSQGFSPALEVPYMFKMRVESTPGQGGLYRLKVWEDGQDEPSTWNLTYQEGSSDLAHGSFMLLAHHVDATFGDVSVVPLSDTATALTVNTVGSGAVTVDPNQPAYAYGQVLTLTAVADAGWTFSDWSGDLLGSDNPINLTMDGDKVVTATFTQDEYTLTVNTVGQGSVVADPAQSTYHYGDVVTLTATPDPSWTFAGWSGDLTSADNPVPVTVTGNTTVTATFIPQDTYILTVDIVGEGSVTRDPDLPTYGYGQAVTLTATPDHGWTFAGWSGDLSGADVTAVLIITDHATVTATFTTHRILLPLVVLRTQNDPLHKVQLSTSYDYVNKGAAAR